MHSERNNWFFVLNDFDHDAQLVKNNGKMKNYA